MTYLFCWSSATVAAAPQRRARQMTTPWGGFVRNDGGRRPSSGLHPHRRQHRAQLGSRRDAELRKGAVQVRADRAVREKQLLADLTVRQSLCGKLGYLKLLRGQLVASLGRAASAAFPRCAQLAPRLLAPRRASERIEGVTRGPQDAAGLGVPSIASKPLPVGELNPGALERPARQVAGERLSEAIGGVRRFRHERPGMTQTERDPGARAGAGARL